MTKAYYIMTVLYLLYVYDLILSFCLAKVSPSVNNENGSFLDSYMVPTLLIIPHLYQEVYNLHHKIYA